MELLADSMFMAVAVIGVCLLGISKGGFLGLGVMALPLMSLFVPPLQAAAIILPTAIAQDFLTLWVYRRAVERLEPQDHAAEHVRRHVRRLADGGVAVGGAHPPRHRSDCRAVRAAALDSPGASNAGCRSRASRPAIIFGAIGGVTTMLANAGGPAWQIHLLPQKLEKLPYIGTVSILFAASNVVKVPGFLTLGYLTRDNLLVGLTLVPIALLANYAGIWMVRRVSTELFFRIAYVLMFIIAVELIRSSVLELWWG